MPKGIRTNFTYHVPATVDEALAMLREYGDTARVIAGGTDLLPKVKAGVVEFDHLISLKELKELNYLSFDEDGTMHIGATALLWDLELSERVKNDFPALWQGIHSMANTQVRHRGTVAGNICNAVPSCDTAPALIVYDAKVILRKVGGERIVPITEFFTGVCRTCVQPDELLAEIIVPARNPRSSTIYYKYAIRKALDLAMIGVASNVVVEGGFVKDVKLALGAVAVVPKRALNAEKLLLGKELTAELIEEAAAVASQEDCKPISDIRATADYRREMVRIHVRDALKLAAGMEVEVLVK